MQRTKVREIFIRSYKDLALKDIENAAIKGEAKMAGFVLGMCLIDALANLVAGVTKEEINKEESGETKGKAGKRFRDFVKNYLKPINSNYKPHDMYMYLRSPLLHTYTTNSKYIFTDKNKVGKHFEKYGDRTILNLEDFIGDIEKAIKKVSEDIDKSGVVFNNARLFFQSYGYLTVAPLHKFHKP